MSLPQVTHYTDHRAFLTDWLKARKAQEEGYSYATFARDGGCSKSSLANVISGARQPRASTLDAFARAMSLSPTDRNYLGLLVDLGNARHTAKRLEVMERMVGTPNYGQLRDVDAEPAKGIERYLANWWTPAIRELSTHPAFQADPVWVARTLNPPISVEEAREALNTLFELDFLRRAEDGSVHAREVRFGSGPETHHGAVATFNRQEVAGLLAGLDATQHQHQLVSTATLLLDPVVLDELKARLTSSLQQAGNLADSRDPSSPARAYQLSVQLLPLSHTVGKEAT